MHYILLISIKITIILNNFKSGIDACLLSHYNYFIHLNTLCKQYTVSSK